MVNLVVGLVCLAVHLSVCPVTACKIFLILSMMMDYDLGMMLVISPGWCCLVSQMHRQKRMFLKKVLMVQSCRGSKPACIGALSPMFTNYIRFVLATHKGQVGWFKTCFILVLVYMHGDDRWYNTTVHTLQRYAGSLQTRVQMAGLLITCSDFFY